MPVVINNFIGFETGGLEESFAIVGAPVAQTSVVRSGTYALHLPSTSDSEYEIFPFGAGVLDPPFKVIV